MAKQSRFVDENDLIQIDLGDDDWVKIPRRLPYGVVEKMTGGTGMSDGARATAFLKAIIKEWNLTDSEGKGVAVSEDNIRKLDIATVNMIGQAIAPLLEQTKKAEMPSAPQS